MFFLGEDGWIWVVYVNGSETTIMYLYRYMFYILYV